MLGAWAADGSSPKAALGVEGAAAMRAQLPGDARSLAEVERAGLWLVADRTKLLQTEGGCAAYEGFIPDDDLRPAHIARALGDAGNWREAPEGHYVLAHADASGRLALLRALSGGERLYYHRAGTLVVFSSTLRALLAHPAFTRRLNRGKIREAMLTGLVLSGDETLIDGIAEVPAGHVLRLGGTETASRWYFDGLLEPLEGDAGTLAARYRDALARAIVACAGRARPVALTLSGGIDSAAITALAVEAFGAGGVEVFTYEFDDPTHPSETRYAVEVCRRLGVSRHRIFKIGLDEFIAAIPETVWRAESFVHWPKAFMLLATRHIRDAGHDRYLCGFGIGSHMAYYQDLAWLLGWLPARALGAYWRLAHRRPFGWLGRLERVHPALAPPNLRMLYLLSSLLSRRDRLPGPMYCYPRRLGAALASLPDGTGPDEAFREMALGELIRHQSFAHLVSCVDVTRWEKPLREVGAYRLSPAHMASTIPFAYLPYRPQPFVWSPARRLRPGKHLLRIAMRDRLPESVIYRRKSWADAVISPRWLAAGRRWMRQAVGDPRPIVDPDGAADPRVLARWDALSPQSAVTGLAFWHRLFVERPPSPRPPTWEELLSPTCPR